MKHVNKIFDFVSCFRILFHCDCLFLFDIRPKTVVELNAFFHTLLYESIFINFSDLIIIFFLFLVSVICRGALPKLDHFDFAVTVLGRICIEFKLQYIIGKSIHLPTYTQNLEAKEALQQCEENFKDKNPRLVQLRRQCPKMNHRLPRLDQQQ